MPSQTVATRSLSHARAKWRDAFARSSMVASRAAAVSRFGAIAAGLRGREIIVLRSGDGRHASGLFSEFAAVIGFLEHYERWRRFYAGARVEFLDGLYVDNAHGTNWWQYYFEPISLGHDSGAPLRALGQHHHDFFAYRVERRMPRRTAARLVDRHVRVRPEIQQAIDSYVRDHWQGARVIGVHYRGTDKSAEARRVSYEEIGASISDRIKHLAAASWRIFLATDEHDFVEWMRARLGDRLLWRAMFRSRDGRPIDVTNADGNYQKGFDAVVDCLLLSRTEHLIRTSSNLGLCATFFNPLLAQTLVSRER
jgi:hypothetical protein